MAAGRSRPKSEEPWQTMWVRVRVVRGRAEVYADVSLSHVTGVVGSDSPTPRPLWSGVIARRDAEVAVTAEGCAVWALGALERAFPRLF